MSKSTPPAVGFPKEYAPIEDGITLYTCSTSNGVKIPIALELLNIPFKTYNIDLTTGIQKSEWFIQNVNPNGHIPAIVDNTKREGTKVFESGAILFYLTEKYDKNHVLSFSRGSPEYFETIEWLFVQNASVGPMQAQYNCNIFAQKKIGHGIQQYYVDEIRRLYTVLERRLLENNSGFLVGNHVSIADIINVTCVIVAYLLEIDVKKEYPALAAWVHRIIKMPGVLKGFNTPTPFCAFASGVWTTD